MQELNLAGDGLESTRSQLSPAQQVPRMPPLNLCPFLIALPRKSGFNGKI